MDTLPAVAGSARPELTGLTVAVIHYQTPALLADCLQRVRQAAPGARLLVIDTGDTAPLPQDWPQLNPGVELLRRPNRGYAAAVNAAIRTCSSPFLVQMNADVLVGPDTFRSLLRVLEQGVALAGPSVVTGSGGRQDQGLPYRWHYWRLKRRRGAASPAWLPVRWLSGCLQAVRLDAVETAGGMDESFRFYNEDVEWCLRLRQHGLTCALVDTEVTHLAGSSTPSRPEFIVEGLRGGYLVTRAYGLPLAAAAQRGFVLLWALAASLLAPGAVQRTAFRQVLRMFWRGSFHESPFGATLRDTAGRDAGSGGAR
jgi:GT2 family glycosyltransferase